MAKQSKGQKETVERVMHEYKHGELKSGPGGKGGKVKNPKQAIAIALHESGASKQESPSKNKAALKKTKAKEAKGNTAQQEKEGKGAMTHNRSELYEEAKKREIPGRSKMNKAQLEKALHRH
jgi:hypothetical protein